MLCAFDVYTLARNKKNNMGYGRKQVFKRKVIKEYESTLENAAFNAMKLTGLPPSTRPIRLDINITFPDRRRRDLQNVSDCICDSLNNIVYEDDVQIVELHMTKSYEKGLSKISIEVFEL